MRRSLSPGDTSLTAHASGQSLMAIRCGRTRFPPPINSCIIYVISFNPSAKWIVQKQMFCAQTLGPTKVVSDRVWKKRRISIVRSSRLLTCFFLSVCIIIFLYNFYIYVLCHIFICFSLCVQLIRNTFNFNKKNGTVFSEKWNLNWNRI